MVRQASGFLWSLRSKISFNTETLQNVFSEFVLPILRRSDEWALHMLGDLLDVADLIRATTDVDDDAHSGLETKGQKN